MVVDATSRQLYVFGGKYYNSLGQAQYSGLYRYSLASRSWDVLSNDVDPYTGSFLTSASIPSRIGHSMLLDAANRSLIVLAGQRVDAYLSDLWTYRIEDNIWECCEGDSSVSGGPDGGFTQRATMDYKRREFVLLSGLVRDRIPPHHTNVKVSAQGRFETVARWLTALRQNSIWIRSLQSHEWRKVDGVHVSGSLGDDAMDIDQEEPKARFAHQFVYDSIRDEHYVGSSRPAYKGSTDQPLLSTAIRW